MNDARFATLLDINAILSYLAVVITIGVLVLIGIAVALVRIMRTGMMFNIDLEQDPGPGEKTPAPVNNRTLRVVSSKRSGTDG